MRYAVLFGTSPRWRIGGLPSDEASRIARRRAREAGHPVVVLDADGVWLVPPSTDAAELLTGERGEERLRALGVEVNDDLFIALHGEHPGYEDYSLYDYDTNDYVREATPEEARASLDAARWGGAGVIRIEEENGETRRVYAL